jgi:acyl carrier protein
MNTIDEKLRYILIDFEIDDRLIPDEALFSDDLGIPSQKIHKLAKKIEKGFSVKAPMSPQSEWNSIAGIRSYLRSHIS